jgi:hypothetical protein
MVAERQDGCTELVTGRVRAGGEDGRDEHLQLVEGEPVALVFGPDEFGHEVIGRRSSTMTALL